MFNPNPSSNARRLPWLGIAGLAFALAAVSVMSALPAVSGELYQWKDANGVTHYSDAPPPAGGDYKNRTIRDSGSATLATAAVAETPAESSQCTTARGNLELLQGEGPVGADTDQDGKPDAAFTAEQRAAQAQLAEAAITVHCSDASDSGASDSDAEAS